LVLAGEYRDTIRRGRAPPLALPWRSNRIVSTAWPLVAALLRGERMAGIAFCAVGDGAASWDDRAPDDAPDATHLAHETARVPIATADIGYVDAVGGAASTPTHRLSMAVTVTATTSSMRLREFALFGGEATAALNSGRMINYVIHPRIDLAVGDVLTRTIRMSFRPTGRTAVSTDLGAVPVHWLATKSAEMIDGVGAKVLSALRKLQVTTIGDLARLAPGAKSTVITPARAVELRGKARLALRIAADVAPAPPLAALSLNDIVTADPAALPSSVPPTRIETLQEQLALLQLSLDAQFLAQTTLGQLTAK
jgi:hypothetical protein